VVVGRARDADLQVRHAAVARKQLTIERVISPIGSRFRVIPHESRNPVLVNGKTAVEGAIKFGDVVAIGEVRLMLEPSPRADEPETPAKRAIQTAVVVVMPIVLGAAIALFASSRGPAVPAPELNDKLFANLPVVSCFDPDTCAERARQAHAHARTFARQGNTVAGNWYRAAIELYRAREFQRLAGQPIAGLEDLQDRLRESAVAAETVYEDLLFQLARDVKAHDVAELRKTIHKLEAALPDAEHPIRVKLAEYLRDNPVVAAAPEESKKP
jgi:hypothetical protein